MARMGLFEADRPVGEYARIARLAVVVADRRLPKYASKFSRKDLTQPQLVAMLALKGLMDHTSRDAHDFLKASGGVRGALGVDKAPHRTTLERNCNTPGMLEIVEAVQVELVRMMAELARLEAQDAAADSTGFETTIRSAYYAKRSRKPAEFIKASVVAALALMAPCVLVMTAGASNDMAQAREVVDKACAAVPVGRLFADAGYDSEALHRLCREVHGVESIIKPVPKSRDGTIKTPYRSLMDPLPESYGQRARIESIFSAIKRCRGSRLRGRSIAALKIELAFKFLGYTLKVH